jgi:hypothetical protein
LNINEEAIDAIPRESQYVPLVRGCFCFFI